MVGTCLQFDYSNRGSHTTYFTDGIATLQFTADDKGRQWLRYIGTSQDFGKKESLSWQGVRASPEESAVIHGTDDQARAELIKRYAAKVPQARSVNNGPKLKVQTTPD
jgi:hypothetical protein